MLSLPRPPPTPAHSNTTLWVPHSSTLAFIRPLEMKIESAAVAAADAKCHFGKCGRSTISLSPPPTLALCIPLPLAMPQFKCRLTHCDAIASFLPFCFLSQIVCALELAKVEHVSALPPFTCRLPLATCHLAHYFRGKHFAEL